MSTVIELNNHRLMNGDATSKSDVAELIGDCKVNLLLTDPPYGIDIVKIGGGKLVDKADTQLDHSRERERERERAFGINWRSQTADIQQIKEGADGNSRNTTKASFNGEEQIAYGKVGKPRRCTAKTL